MSDLSVWRPEKETTIPDFPLALLGYQRKAVDSYLKGLAETPNPGTEIVELPVEAATPADQLDRYRDLGREIADLLLSVQQTAARIRERAESDAAGWREDATVEVQNRVAEAQSTAEELRAAAWEVSEEMIAQMENMEQQAYRSIEKHSQGVIAEAENEAHRVREEARRKADSIRSNAHVESIDVEERTRALCDQMIESAEQKVTAIQERVLALERHRDQLLEEIGGIRSGAAPIGVKLVDQAGGLIYPTPLEEDETVHVTPRHEMSGLVRVIAPTEQSEGSAPRPAENETAEMSDQSDQDQRKDDEAGEEEVAEGLVQASDQPFQDLFASLRQTVVPSSGPARRPQVSSPAVRVGRMDEEQSIELREEMLLPISNQFLRRFKRLLTEEQNRVLEGLRTGQLAWGAEEVSGRMRSHLEMVVEQSWQAGHQAAVRLSGRDLPEPALVAGAEDGFATQLVDEVTAAIGPSGSAEPAQRNRMASRAFRVWRNEKLEGWLREVSERYYGEGLSASLNTAGAARS